MTAHENPTQAPPVLPRPDRAQWWLLASTPIVVLITHYAVVLPHEFAHSFTAWVLGAKPNPWAIDWGGFSIPNVLLLIHVDENVDYSPLFDHGEGWKAALIAAAGPLVVNGGMWVGLTVALLRYGWRWHPLTVYVTLWLMLLSLANVYDYIPLRCFTDGDISNLTRGLGVSPWVIYIVGSYLVVAGMIGVFTRVLPVSLAYSGITSPAARAVVLFLVTAIVFGYFAEPALVSARDVTKFMGLTSVAAIPAIIALCWRPMVSTSPTQRLASPHREGYKPRTGPSPRASA
jgi:hypothetical protein